MKKTFIIWMILAVLCSACGLEENTGTDNQDISFQVSDYISLSENDISEDNASGNVISEDAEDVISENDVSVSGASDHIISENAISGNKIYDPVLEEYRDMVQNDFYMDLLGTDDYDSSFGEHIGSEIRMREQAVFYTFYDIDGNGTQELIIAAGDPDIGVSNPAFSPWYYDLYGYDGTNVVHIFPEMEFGYRTNFSLCENGMIEVFYTASAAESGVDFYQIAADGVGTELVDSFFTVGHLEGDEPVFTYYQNEAEITEEEYNTKIQDFEILSATALEWVEIY